MKRITIFTLIALLFFAAPLKAENAPTGAELKALAEALDEQSESKFQLWNDCKPMHLQVVVNIGAFNRDEGLTNTGVQQMLTRIMSSRLSSAYLYEPDAIPFLRVLVVGGFLLSDEYDTYAIYNKVLHDPASGIYRLAPAWRSNVILGNAGLRTNIVSAIESKVSRVVDGFIAAYQSVNSDACE